MDLIEEVQTHERLVLKATRAAGSPNTFTINSEYNMKVSQVIKALQELEKIDPDAIVILQSDSEGNNYSPASGVDIDSIYEAENSYSGQAYDPSWSAGDACKADEEWEEILKKPRCAVIYPIN